MRLTSSPDCGIEPRLQGIVLRYVLAWISMLVIAVVNGALREATLAKVMPDLRAHQVSTLTGSSRAPGPPARGLPAR